MDDNYQYTVKHVEHMGIPQRWMVVHSKAAGERTKKTIIKQVERDKLKLEKDLFHLQAQHFACKHDALKALGDLNKQQSYHQLTQPDCLEHKIYEGKGWPKKDAPVKSILWQVCAEIEQKQEVIQHATEQKSCFVLATNAAEQDLSPEAVLRHLYGLP